MTLPSLALPGQQLAPCTRSQPGSGTHVQAAHVHASIAGPVTESQPEAASAGNPAVTAPSSSISVSSSLPNGISSRLFPLSSAPSLIPDVGSTVLARVTRLTHRQAVADILVVDDRICRDGWAAIIRSQDVRATEKDKVKVGESFRVGDVVRGVVISLGDQAAYYLSTASNHLGVILATSVAGNQMYPISWREFRDPETGLTEVRKVAKPF